MPMSADDGGLNQPRTELLHRRCRGEVRQGNRWIKKQLGECARRKSRSKLQVPRGPQIKSCRHSIGGKHHAADAIVQVRGNSAAHDRRARGNMETGGLEERQTNERQHWALQMRSQQNDTGGGLAHGVKIGREQPINYDLSSGEGTGKNKFEVRHLKDEPSLKKAFEHRTFQHQQRAADYDFAAQQFAKTPLVAKVEQNAEGKYQRRKTYAGAGAAQLPGEPKSAAFEQREPEIPKRFIHQLG